MEQPLTYNDTLTANDRKALLNAFFRLNKHNPKVNPESVLFRLDGRLEWICEHGVGHTVWYPQRLSPEHGCDFCCRNIIPLPTPIEPDRNK